MLKEALRAGAASEGLLVRAGRQTGGRGRHGRTWVSDAGNLYLSLLLRPGCDAREIGIFSLLAGLGVYQAARAFLSSEEGLQLKWPNDLLLGGRKCAGILLETDLSAQGLVEALMVGVGVNLACAPEEGAALNDFASVPVTPEAFQDVFLEKIEALYAAWRDGQNAEILERWLAAAHPKGTPLSVKIGSDIRQGRFYGLDGQGNLILSLDGNRLQTITAGDVYLT